jgi:hypothetical protein
MLGLSRVTRPRASAAASAPGNRDADGYDCPVTGLRRQALLIPADPGTSRRARRSDKRVTATYFAIGQPASPVTIDIWFERVSRWALTPARLPDGEGIHA